MFSPSDHPPTFPTSHLYHPPPVGNNAGAIFGILNSFFLVSYRSINPNPGRRIQSLENLLLEYQQQAFSSDSHKTQRSKLRAEKSKSEIFVRYPFPERKRLHQIPLLSSRLVRLFLVYSLSHCCGLLPPTQSRHPRKKTSLPPTTEHRGICSLFLVTSIMLYLFCNLILLYPTYQDCRRYQD